MESCGWKRLWKVAVGSSGMLWLEEAKVHWQSCSWMRLRCSGKLWLEEAEVGVGWKAVIETLSSDI